MELLLPFSVCISNTRIYIKLSILPYKLSSRKTIPFCKTRIAYQYNFSFHIFNDR